VAAAQTREGGGSQSDDWKSQLLLELLHGQVLPRSLDRLVPIIACWCCACCCYAQQVESHSGVPGVLI
jgi:hypothetical protein